MLLSFYILNRRLGFFFKVTIFIFKMLKASVVFLLPLHIYAAFAKILGDVIFSENIVFSHVRILFFFLKHKKEFYPITNNFLIYTGNDLSSDKNLQWKKCLHFIHNFVHSPLICKS